MPRDQLAYLKKRLHYMRKMQSVRKIPRDLLLRRSKTRLDLLLYMQDDSLFSFRPFSSRIKW